MENQERIVQKAHELFMRYGIRSVSMDEIAAHLGISKKTIYQYYQDKDALVEAVVDIEIGINETMCKTHRDASENALHEIFLATEMTQEMLENMNPAILYDLEKYHPKASKKFYNHKNKFLYEVIKTNLERGIQEELYRPEMNADIITRLRLASIFSVFNPELFPHGKNVLATIIDEITDHFLYGITTAKGQKLILKYKQQRSKK